MSEEFDELCRKAEQFGINVNLILQEAERRILDSAASRVASEEQAIAKRIIDSIPSLKPEPVDIDALVEKVQEKVKIIQADTDAIKEAVVNAVLARMPDTAKVERQTLMTDAATQVKEFMGNIEQKIQPLIAPLVREALDEQVNDVVEKLRAEMAQQREDFVKQLKGEGGKAAGGRLGPIPWDQVLPVIQTMVEKDKDPFAAIDSFISMRERLSKLMPESSGPDVTQQLRVAGQSLIEGVKIGAKARGISEPKNLSSLPGGRSKSPVGSSGLHPAIERL